MAVVNRNLTVLVPAEHSTLAELLEGRCADLASTTRIVRIRDTADLNQSVEENPLCCLFGELSGSWEENGTIFDITKSTNILWPPAYAVTPRVFDKAELNTLSQSGVVWAADIDSLMSAAELNLVLAGNAWKTQFGFLFQKLNRQTISSGEYLVVCTTEKGQYARIQFRNGNVVACEYGDETGIEALYKIALVDNWRIDVHHVFLGIEPRLMNKPLMKVIRRLVEMADERKQVLSMGRPPGMTRELSSRVVTGIRKALASGDAKTAEKLLKENGENEPSWEASGVIMRGDSEVAEQSPPEKPAEAEAPKAKAPVEKPPEAKKPENLSGSRILNNVSSKKGSGGNMADLTLQEFVANINGSFGGAIITTDGAYTAAEGDFDVDTVAAVASMSTEHLGGIANALNIQGLEIASFTGTAYTVFLKRQGDTFVVSFGNSVKNPGVTAKKLSGKK